MPVSDQAGWWGRGWAAQWTQRKHLHGGSSGLFTATWRASWPFVHRGLPVTSGVSWVHYSRHLCFPDGALQESLPRPHPSRRQPSVWQEDRRTAQRAWVGCASSLRSLCVHYGGESSVWIRQPSHVGPQRHTAQAVIDAHNGGRKCWQKSLTCFHYTLVLKVWEIRDSI